MGKIRSLCGVWWWGSEERNQPSQRSLCYDNLSETAVSNVQTISAIHGFLYGLIDGERFLRSEPNVSVSSWLALSVQGHSTSDSPVPPRDRRWDNAGRHASGALLQGGGRRATTSLLDIQPRAETSVNLTRRRIFGEYVYHKSQ